MRKQFRNERRACEAASLLPLAVSYRVVWVG